MRSILTLSSSFVFILILIILEGCDKNPTAPAEVQNKDGSWTIYTPYDWTHDGHPRQSTYCTVYSDAASEEMKQHLAEIADDNFLRILQLFNFQNISDFKYPPGYSKIEIYLNINQPENINWAYWGGFIITIRSSEISGQWVDYTVYTAGHELTHVFEFLIEGKEILDTDVWFREGLAVHVGCMESSIFKTIDSLSELEAWISENQNIAGNGNPVKIHQHSDFPEGTEIHNYYRIFELAFRYIVDPNGLGKSYDDVLNLFYDVRNDIPFSTAFSDNFGLSLVEYEDNFYELMEIYLGSVQ